MTTENADVHGTVMDSRHDTELKASPAVEPPGQALEAPDDEPDPAEEDASSLPAADSDRSPGSMGALAGITEDDERCLTTADITAADSDALAHSTVEHGDNPADGTAEGSDVPAQAGPASVEAGAKASEDGTDDDGDQDEIILADSADAVAHDLAAAAPVQSRLSSDGEFADDAGLAGDAEEIRHRWAAIQSSFVDDPYGSVADAASFVSEVMTTLLANAGEREHELRGQWDRGDLDTEDLRNVLRRYRGFLYQLAVL